MTTNTPMNTVTHRHSPPACGEFRFDVATEQWWWSDETYRMHGFTPGDVAPTTSLVLAHKHPDDRARVKSLLERVAADGALTHSVHRIMDATAHAREILLIAVGEHGPDGRVTSVVGCFVDLTSAVREAADRRATEEIHAADASRAVIEQAKGVLAVTLDISPEETLHILRAASNRSNVPLRTIAAWLLSSARIASRRGMLEADDVVGFLRNPIPPDGTEAAETVSPS